MYIKKYSSVDASGEHSVFPFGLMNKPRYECFSRVSMCDFCVYVCFHYLFVGCVFVDSRSLRCSTGTHVPTSTHTHTHSSNPLHRYKHTYELTTPTHAPLEMQKTCVGCVGVCVIISCGLARIPVTMWLPGKLNMNKQIDEQPTVGTNRGTVQAGRM
jgi:hypothetical protein